MSIAMTTSNVTMRNLKHNSELAMIAIQNSSMNKQISNNQISNKQIAKSGSLHTALNHKNILRKKRKEVLKRKITGIVFSILLICLLSFILGNVSSKAMQEKTKPNMTKYFTSIQIQDGESLWEIASNNLNTEYYDLDSYMEEIASINNISEDESLLAGEFVIIPYFAETNEITVASINP